MRLFIDLDTRGFIESETFPRPITSLAFKRGDNVPVDLCFVRGGTIQELAEGATGKIGLKPKGQFGSNFYLALDENWEKSGEGAATKYAFSLNLATTEIESAFLAEPDAVPAMLEIEWVESGLRTSSATLDVELQNDVNQGDEGVPQLATPVYPPSTDVLTKSGNLSGIADAGEARSNLGLDDLLALKADLVSGKVPASQLPSYVDDVVESADFAALPSPGETGKIYVTLDSAQTYRWTGSAYLEISNVDTVARAAADDAQASADAATKTLTVADETALLALASPAIQTGDDVVVVAATSHTEPYGVAKVINPASSGWAKFSVTSTENGKRLFDDAGRLAFDAGERSLHCWIGEDLAMVARWDEGAFECQNSLIIKGSGIAPPVLDFAENGTPQGYINFGNAITFSQGGTTDYAGVDLYGVWSFGFRTTSNSAWFDDSGSGGFGGNLDVNGLISANGGIDLITSNSPLYAAEITTFGSEVGFPSGLSVGGGNATLWSDGSLHLNNWLRLVEIGLEPTSDEGQATFFARDNGSGKTQICVKFETGAVQVLATEP